MQTGIETNNSNRYLLCNYRFSDDLIKMIQEDVKRFMADKEKDDNYFKFINWQKKDNEITVLTMYAYDDIQLPKKFDTIFQIDEPEKSIYIDYVITQSVINGWAAVNHLSKGHKHICVIEFDKKVPEIFNSVPFFNLKDTLQNSDFELGFCDKTNLKVIQD